jgi:ribonuclease P protein component
MKKEYRVKKDDEILRIMKNKKSTGNKYFVVYALYKKDQTHYRYAVSVSKKYGNAVKRNKIKRQVREVVEAQNILPNYDIFVVIKPTVSNLSFAEIQNNISLLVKKHNISEVKK